MSIQIKIYRRFMLYSFPRQLVLVISVVLILEFCTMLLLSFLPGLPIVFMALIDCATLLILLSPAIYFAIRKERKYVLEQNRTKNLIKEKENHFYTLANSGQALIWTSGKTMKPDYFNEPWLAYTGRDMDQEIENGWLEGIHQDDLKKFNEMYQQAFVNQESFVAEFRLRSSGGAYRWFQNNGTPRFNNKGDFIGYIGHCFDITPRVQMDLYREKTREILKILNATTDTEALLQQVVEALKTDTGFDAVAIRLQEGNDYPYVAYSGFSKSFFNAEKSLFSFDADNQVLRDVKGNVKLACACGLVISGQSDFLDVSLTPGGSWWSNDTKELLKISPEDEKLFQQRNHCIHEGYASVALIPVRNKEIITGLIQLNSRSKDRFSKEIIEKLEGIASHLGAALLHRKAEALIREKEEILSKAEELAHLGSWSLNLVTNQLTWSDEVYRIFGITPQDFPASYQGFLEAIHPDDRETVNQTYLESVGEGRDGYEMEHRVIQKNTGQVRYVFEKCEHSKDVDGRVTGSMGMIMDVTERKKTLDQLREKERLLRESQEVAHIGSYSFNMNDLTWSVSDEVYRIFGIDESYPNTLDVWIQSLHPDFKETLLDDLFQNTEGKQEFEHEYKILRFDNGEERWVHGVGKFEYNQQQERVRLIGTIQDVTRRKVAEEALLQLNEELEFRVGERTLELEQVNKQLLDEIKIRREKEFELIKAEEKYRTIADHNYAWETWLDVDGKFIYVSPSCYRITGYHAEAFMHDATLFYRIVHPDDQEMVRDLFSSQMGNMPDISFDYRIITQKGEERWLTHFCHSVFTADGTWLGQRGSNMDITSRKKAESLLLESQATLRALTQHMNQMMEQERKHIAHEVHDELGHLLTALKYDIDSLEGDPELSVETVKAELPVINGMIESLLESVRKIAADLRPGILDHLGLFPAIEWQINQFRMMTKINCEYHSVEHSVTFNKEETTTIFRILQEILTNITRHSRATHVVVSVSYFDDCFKLKVTDNGIGFKLHFNSEGSSMGLIGMQERALSIGGELDIESEPGKGTTVTLLLHKK